MQRRGCSNGPEGFSEFATTTAFYLVGLKSWYLQDSGTFHVITVPVGKTICKLKFLRFLEVLFCAAFVQKNFASGLYNGLLLPGM